ncbi:MAG: hypothetical protein PHH54_01125 [Candidatus Nanoarchaeia archaeon]|nr:hypothetical protein [Candidatus Nanoarchaeia archaeon]MDD5740566.1 hypothetical protein [Candidatus Nanoarchaeia archaeon]
MKEISKKLIVIFVTVGFIWYLYTILTNWQLTTDGVLWVGIIRILIPLSVNIIIYAIVYDKIKLWSPIQDKEKR